MNVVVTPCYLRLLSSSNVELAQIICSESLSPKPEVVRFQLLNGNQAREWNQSTMIDYSCLKICSEGFPSLQFNRTAGQLWRTKLAGNPQRISASLRGALATCCCAMLRLKLGVSSTDLSATVSQSDGFLACFGCESLKLKHTEDRNWQITSNYIYQITLPTRLANNSTDVKKQQNTKVIAHPAVIIAWELLGLFLIAAFVVPLFVVCGTSHQAAADVLFFRILSTWLLDPWMNFWLQQIRQRMGQAIRDRGTDVKSKEYDRLLWPTLGHHSTLCTHGARGGASTALCTCNRCGSGSMCAVPRLYGLWWNGGHGMS